MATIKKHIDTLVAFSGKCVLILALVCISLLLHAQSEGDYRSYQSGSWQTPANWQVYSSGAWVSATNYPGQSAGNYSATIEYGHNINIGISGITTETFSHLYISGCLTLAGEENNSVNYVINVSEIYVYPSLTPYATIYFVNKCVLWLPQNSVIKVWTGGLSGECNNNHEIRIGPYEYSTFAYCNGAPGNIFTFDELMAGGGTLNAVLSASETSVCLGESISLTGSYSGAVSTAPTYLWTSTGPDSISFNPSSVSQNPYITPATPGTYYVKLTVQTDNEGTTYSNTDSLEIIVGKKSSDPLSVEAGLTTIMTGCSTTLTLTGGGGGSPEQIKWYTDACGSVLAGTGNNLVVSPTEQTTYYGRYENPEPCNYITNCSQITIDVVPFANVWEGSVDTSFSVAANWQGNVVPLDGENVLFSEFPVNNCVLDKDFTVATLANSSEKHFVISDYNLTVLDGINFSNLGKIYADDEFSKIIYAGSEPQLLNAGMFYENKINNLEINNPSGLSLDGDVNITSVLNIIDGDFQILSNTLTLNGDLRYPGGSLSGGSSSNLNVVNCSQLISLQGMTLNNLNLDSGNDLILEGDVCISGTLNLIYGTLNTSNNKLTICGGLSGTSGIINATGNMAKVEFANIQPLSVPQNIFYQQIYDLTINGAGISLNGDVTVKNTLEFVAGNITTNDNVLALTESANLVAGAGPGKCINGFCRKTGNTAFVFPVGNDTLYAPVGISAANGGGNPADYFTASYYFNMPGDLFDSTMYEPDIVRISESEYWILDRNGTNNVSVTLSWDERSGSISDISSLTVARWDGTTWRDEGNAGTTGDVLAGTIQSDTVSNFSPFTLASRDFYENLLPVELISFYALCQGYEIEIVWETATEKNSSYFDLEKSYDMKVWDLLERKAGAGNSASASFYSARDSDIKMDQLYYRLKQYDYDGSQTIYNPVYVNSCKELSGSLCQVFHDQISETLSVNLTGNTCEAGLTIYDMRGRFILQQKVEEGSGISVSDLSSGLYLYKITAGTQIYSGKLIKD